MVVGVAAGLSVSTDRRMFLGTLAVVPGPCGAATARELVAKGMRLFEENDVEGSLAAFDEAADVAPGVKSRLWQRGLSLYYVDDFENAAEQFRSDVAQNPNDTEESIWFYLSTARLGKRGPKLLDVGTDPRFVMRVVYDMFTGGDVTKVEAIAADAKANPANRFYAALYRGLYAEAQGDADASKDYITAALSTPGYSNPKADYMVALAQVHAKRRGYF
mmetsp:Transcript_14354/g.46850  ORF Transcript_14354/g.46850 Transcript_14354/m.46850 type:complete len:218 (-) Transcript_14354:900-1553(-)